MKKERDVSWCDEAEGLRGLASAFFFFSLERAPAIVSKCTRNEDEPESP